MGVRAGFASLALLLCAVSAAVGCGGATDEPRCEGDECEPEPRRCAPGDAPDAESTSALRSDGCSTCSCVRGEWQCSTVSCTTPACVYGGLVRSEGSRFLALDGCNECTCSGGLVACTERACTTVPTACSFGGERLADGESRPSADGCNQCTCSNGSMVCTDRACSAGCYGDSACGEGQYCHFPEGVCLGADSRGAAETEELRAPDPGAADRDVAGECRTRPTLCSGDDEPVCGCDGVTYRTACAAASLGLSIASLGPCPQN